MPRPARQIPPFFSRREILQLVFLTALLVFLVASLERIRSPRSWSWLFAERIDTQLADEAAVPPPAEGRFGQVLPEPVLGHQPGDVPPGPAPPAATTQVNPLGLQQIGECTEVDKSLLRAVKDEVNVAERKRYSQADVDDLRRQGTPAIYQLLCVAATTPPERLAAASRRDVFYSNLWKDPDVYRGQPVRIRGILHRLEIESENARTKNPYGIDRVYLAWILLEEAGEFVVVLCTALPEGLAPGMNLKENVTIDAFFAKLYAYQSQEGRWRASPMLAGHRLEWHKTPTSLLGSQAAVVIAVLVGVILILGLFFWWISARDERLARTLHAQSGAPPEVVPDFLQSPEPRPPGPPG